ncbi:putative repeat protein (TIGR03943 family) [Natranaerovirga hydrolytica]|uniref:Putative repeat protein (TIGR03943 family) n=1 Tax=Natranaerovirga hydrolytica TaxID=680378 RepID=A0A4R1MZ11_9FIRM|nr:TIGR03943 family protein [Natranaerovirga hydrolytica]TCK97782.1 putative repeat protein (TIGR03943 family) [Natranaerovirga hydrolytica]
MKLRKKQPINIYIILQSSIIILFLLAFIYILKEDWLLKYLHPRMAKYVWIAIVLFAGIILSYIKQLFSYKKGKRIPYSYLIFLMPILLMFLVPPVTIDSSSIQESRVNRMSIESNTTNNTESVKDERDNSSISQLNAPFNNSALYSNNGVLEIEKDDFYSSLMELYYDLDSYVGQQIAIEGFVYRDDLTQENEFIVSQLLMSCCVADVQLIGLICEYNHTEDLLMDQWVKVHGTLTRGEGDNQQMAVIKVKQIEEIDEPNHIYIYPY